MEKMQNYRIEKLGKKAERRNYSKVSGSLDLPDLVEVQTQSFEWFIREGIREVFEDISPIKDYADNLVLEFIDNSLTDAPKYEQEECKERDVTYAAPLKVRVRLINKETGEVKEQEVFMGDFPLMTEKGTFIYNGAERVVNEKSYFLCIILFPLLASATHNELLDVKYANPPCMVAVPP